MAIPRSILMARERKRLESVAEAQGYESAAAMIYDMYIVQDIPIEKISHTLITPMWSLRKRFDELGITVDTRGGRNNVCVEITPELLQEVARDGVPAAAERLGVDTQGLRTRLIKEITKKL